MFVLAVCDLVWAVTVYS